MEPWMRGTHRELDTVRRGVVHALEMAEEDMERWCAGLDDQAMFARPGGLPSVAYHLRHMVRSLDRLLSYAEGRGLDAAQLLALDTEMAPGTAQEVKREFREGMVQAKERIRRFLPEAYEQERGIGRKRLPTTIGGLLVHCAEHTQRHAGQMVTTAKLVSRPDAEGTA